MLEERSSAELSAEPGHSTPLPDVEAAERGEDDPQNQGHRNGEDQSQDLVDHVLAELKQSVAADPDLVEGVGELGLRDHILEPQLEQEEAQPSRGAGARGPRGEPPSPGTRAPAPAPPAPGPVRPGPHLQVGVQPVWIAVQLVLRALLRVGQRGAAAPREVVVVVHEDAGVHFLRLQPHGAAAAARLRPGPAPSAAAAPPGRAGAERGCPGHAPRAAPAAGALPGPTGPQGPAGRARGGRPPAAPCPQLGSRSVGADLARLRWVSPSVCGARLSPQAPARLEFVSACGIATTGAAETKSGGDCALGHAGPCLCPSAAVGEKGKEGGRRGGSPLPTEVPVPGSTGPSHSTGIYLTRAA